MKKGYCALTVCAVAAAAVLLASQVPVGAAQGSGDSYTSVEFPETWRHTGEEIRLTEVDGFRLSYQLLPAAASEAAQSPGARHLMLFVLDPAGNLVRDAEVRLDVGRPGTNGPARAARPMAGGFGLDVEGPGLGAYAVHATVAVGERLLRDDFSYVLVRSCDS